VAALLSTLHRTVIVSSVLTAVGVVVVGVVVVVATASARRRCHPLSPSLAESSLESWT
jgi:hypothetical protein